MAYHETFWLAVVQRRQLRPCGNGLDGKVRPVVNTLNSVAITRMTVSALVPV
jgi:hypothetical protein